MAAQTKCYLGVDVGTSGAKALLTTAEGRVLARATETYPVDWLRPGWAEQDPDVWWRATVLAIRACVGEAGIEPRAIAGMSLSGQMHSSVLLDDRRRVVRPAILWCDGRTSAQCLDITERIGGKARLIERVANPALEGFTAPKLLWVREHEPDLFRRVKTVLLPKDYVRFRLTGELATEVSDASGTLLYDVAKGGWSRAVLEGLEIDPGVLPPVLQSHEIAGRLSEEAAAEAGLAPGTLVAAGGADNTCGAIGAGAVREGTSLVSLGSSGVVFTPVNRPLLDPMGRLHTFRHSVKDQWYLMGVTLAAGLSLRWFRDQMGQSERAVEESGGPGAYDLLATEAAASSPGSRGLFYLPYLNGERTPHADASARGVFFGLSSAHTRADVVRSVFEGITFSLRDGVEIMRALGSGIGEIRAIGGGAKSPFWRQLLADILGADVLTLKVDEGPAFGAALLAMVAAGEYVSVVEAAERCVEIAARTPCSADRAQYDAAYRFYASLYPALKERFAALAAESALS